ncbi:hypothetical protein GF389_00465 [Candidatus Dojkabacteria bacterium]|nr:hypothetical protein [Candidatus Dojkabacteria bacterium]
MKYPTVNEIKTKNLKNNGDRLNARFSINIKHWDLSELGIYTKSRNTKSDGHFHKGENKSRDPEHVYVITGSIKMLFEDLYGNKREEIVKGGELLITPAWIYHSYEVLEDLVLLEPREVSYKDIPDTYDHNEFSNTKT